MNSISTLTQPISVLGCLTAGLLIVQVLRTGLYRNKGLFAFSIGSLLWFGWFLFRSTPAGVSVVSEIADLIPLYGLVGLSICLIQAAREFLRLKPSERSVLLLFGVVLVVMFSTQVGLAALSLAQYLPAQIVFSILLGIWLVILLIGLTEFAGAYRRDRQPLHRNRLLTWLPVPLLEIIAGGLLFGSLIPAAMLVHLFAAGLLGIVVLSPALPDIKNLLRRFTRYSLAASAFFVYALFFMLIYGVLLEIFPDLNTLIVAAAVLILASLLMKPAFVLVSQASLMLVPELSEQSAQIMRQFTRNLRTGSTLDGLTYQITHAIQEILPVSEVNILNVEKASEADQVVYIISYFKNLPGQTEPLTLSANDPICSNYLGQNKPLSQYLIDYNPGLEKTTPKNRSWFEQSGFDLFIPIVSKDGWIGLICLGSKDNGLPYTVRETEFLVSLADQSAIAFENARLINGLTRLNNEYRRAYTALERTNTSLERTVRQLENLDRFKSDLITVLSHEIRTPMTLIAGYAQMLNDEPEISQHPEWTELVRGISNGTERLEDIVGAILDMASIDAQSLDLSIKAVDVYAVVKEVIQPFEADLNQRKISVSFEKLAGLPILDTDPQLLEKALRQMISNSIKYSPDGSQITLRGKQLLTEASPIGEDSVELEILDQGIGLDEDQLELVFEKFYQTGEAAAHSSGKTKFKGGGPGLGLAIVKGIVNELHGVVWAESGGHDEQQFPGTCFHIVLPLHREKTHKKSQDRGDTLPLGAETEDQP